MRRAGGALSWASLGVPGRLLKVDATEPKFHVVAHREVRRAGGTLSWASLGEPGRLLKVDAAEPKFHVVMRKPGTKGKKGVGPFLCKGPEQGVFGRVWRSF